MPECLYNKVAALMPATLLKKGLWHMRFPMNFAKLLRTPILTEHETPASINIPTEMFITRLSNTRGAF